MGFTAMQCDKRIQLEKNYQDARAAFAAATANFEQRMAICPREEYLALRTTMEQVWAALEQAESALSLHTRQHGCLYKRSLPVSPRQPHLCAAH
jgi:hypothetical protein